MKFKKLAKIVGFGLQRRKKRKGREGGKMSKEKKEIWDKSLPNLADKKRSQLKGGIRGNVRLAMGLFYTNEEYEKMRKRVLKRKLP